MKLSRFTNIFKYENKYILHNTLVDTAISVISPELCRFIDTIEDGEAFHIERSNTFLDILVKLNLIVDEAEDELSTLNGFYYEFEHNSELYVMLIVTRRCNFRCAYCYEDYQNVDMSSEVFENTKEYILGEIKEKHYRKVTVSFFGGEPTLMAKEINEFMSSLLFANENLPEPAYIRAIMTTNGYLLTSKMLHQFVHNHIIRYQITLDGFKDIHDSTRYLANGVGTWETIVENLNNFNNLKEKNVTVLLRSNVTPALYNRIDEWLEFIHNNFCGSAFKIHFEAAKDFGNMNNPDIELIANETDVILDIIDRAKKWKLPLELVGFSTTPFSMMCYASRQSYFIIDYNGDVKKCTSSPLDEPYNNVGKLTERGMTIYKKKAAQWTSYELDDRCKNCSILALCYRRKCPLARYSFAKCELLKKSYEKGIEYRYY